MRRLFRTILILSFIGMTSYGFLPPENNPNEPIQLDLKIYRKKFDAIIASIRTLEQEYPKQVSVIYGRSTNRLPIPFIRIAKSDTFRNKQGPRPAIFLSGATHGGEYMNIVDRLPQTWLSDKDSSTFRQFIEQGGIVYVTPVVNPDGFVRYAHESNRFLRRTNGNDVDLNRDFPLNIVGHEGMTQKETRFVTQTLDKLLRQDKAQLYLTMDYHCCMNPGRLIHPWGYKLNNPEGSNPNHKLNDSRIAIHQAYAQFFKAELGYQSGTAWDEQKETGQPLGGVIGASDDFFFEKYFYQGNKFGAAFTFEGQLGEHRYFVNHKRAWSKIFRQVLVYHNQGTEAPAQTLSNTPNTASEPIQNDRPAGR